MFDDCNTFFKGKPDGRTDLDPDRARGVEGKFGAAPTPDTELCISARDPSRDAGIGSWASLTSRGNGGVTGCYDRP